MSEWKRKDKIYNIYERRPIKSKKCNLSTRKEVQLKVSNCGDIRGNLVTLKVYIGSGIREPCHHFHSCFSDLFKYFLHGCESKQTNYQLYHLYDSGTVHIRNPTGLPQMSYNLDAPDIMARNHHKDVANRDPWKVKSPMGKGEVLRSST